VTYSETIKGGFRLVNRNWQLVAVQAVAKVISCVGFFLLIGIPLMVAFIKFGVDLIGVAETRNVLGMLYNLRDLLSRYFGLVLAVVAGGLLYLLLMTMIWLYTLAGSVGVIGSDIREPSSRFSMHGFFEGARKFFFPLSWYFLVVGLVFVAIFFVLGLFGGGVAALISAARAQDSTLALFLGMFFYLVLMLLGAVLFLGALAATAYGIAVLFFRRTGAIRSFTSGLNFIWTRPDAFWLYVLLLAGYVILSFIVILLISPFYMVPVIGSIFFFPLQIFAVYIVQRYMSLIMTAAVFIYYHDGEMPKGVGETSGAAGVTSEGSSGAEGTSQTRAERPEITPPETEGPPRI
jgi:hypothetical protein